MTGQHYLNFLIHYLPGALEDVPLNLRRTMWYQHDGAPPHSTLNVANFLNDQYHERWIGRRGTIEWPPRSPDLNPCDYFFWGYLKDHVYKVEIQNIQHLQERIEEAINNITPEMIRSAVRNFQTRIDACIRCEGRHFQQYL